MGTSYTVNSYSTSGGRVERLRSGRHLPWLRRFYDTYERSTYWSLIGSEDTRAYHKPGRALCFLKGDDSWCVFVGASREAELTAVASELSLRWNG